MTALFTRTAQTAGAALLALLLPLGCSQQNDRGAESEPSGRITELAEPQNALSEELMLSLSLAKNHHHKADVYLKQARIDDAVTEVRKIFDIRFPRDAAEGEDAVHDARARLAKLLVTQGALDEAMRVVESGIAEASRESFFVANLHSVRGEVFEAMAVSALASDSEAANKARRDAIRAFDRAIQIQEALLDQLSDQGTP